MTVAESGLIEIEPVTLAALLLAGDAVVLDVREQEEWTAERIPGAVCHPMSGFDPDGWPGFPGQMVVIACLGGVRSAAVGRRLIAAGRAWAVHLKGGLRAWRDAGFTTETGE
ncbi:MAG: rhodanese-like domain-containing protein [Magnetospirillum sp.]|nr:rhodanese-like domain-containing protein [Magnetospirillum sp.]